MKEFVYITISDCGPVSPKAKTSMFRVDNKRGGYEIAYIRFYPQWRQYVLEPLHDTVYSTGCLRDIASFMEELNRERRMNGERKDK